MANKMMMVAVFLIAGAAAFSTPPLRPRRPALAARPCCCSLDQHFATGLAVGFFAPYAMVTVMHAMQRAMLLAVCRIDEAFEAARQKKG